MVADAAGEVPVALVNDAVGLGFEVVTRKDQFPCQYQWQNLQSGQYAMGIEPSTNHVLGKPFARERGELSWLDHSGERRYHTVVRPPDGGIARAAREARIRPSTPQTDTDYPQHMAYTATTPRRRVRSTPWTARQPHLPGAGG